MTPAAQRQTKSSLPVLAAAILILAALGAYSNTFEAPFVFDDATSIMDNSTIRQLWPPDVVLSPPANGANVSGRPLANLSFALNYAAGGLNVRGYHVVNLALHALNGLLLFGLVRRTLLRPSLHPRFGDRAGEIAFVVSLLWILHPLQTESVTYVVQRTESLLALFYLLTFYAFVRGLESSRGGSWRAVSVLACLLGMATKEVMVTAPVVVLLFDRTFAGGTWREAWRQRWGYYLALASTWLLQGWLLWQAGGSRADTAGFGLGVSPYSYALTQCRALVMYLKLTVWPHPLVVDYGTAVVSHVGDVALQAALIAVLVGLAARALWRGSDLGFLGGWFFAILAPSSSVVPVITQTMAEHRMYLPLAAVIVLMVTSAYLWLGRRSLALLAGVAVVFGWITVQRNRDYRSAIAVWSDTIAKCPGNARAHQGLGEALAKANRFDDALGECREAVRLQPGSFLARFSLGNVLLETGNLPEAVAQFEAAVQIEPDYGEAHASLVAPLVELRRVPEAMEHYREALRLRPDSYGVHYNLGRALIETGQIPEAVEHFETALRLEPSLAEAHVFLGMALISLQRVPEALQHYAEALRLKPDSAEIQYNVGVGLLQLGQLPESIAHFQTSLRLRPAFYKAHFNLGNALLHAGRLPEAITEYEAALRLNADDANVHHNLGTALLNVGRVADAIHQYQELLRLNPASAGGHYSLGEALRLANQPEEAIKHYEEALRLEPGYTEAREKLEWMQSQRRR